ncbi:MAG: hypothetical protein J7M05_11230 [Anaerolineae bacterium]|nr:hypothetical protein [Anaerolineae bacterium]
MYSVGSKVVHPCYGAGVVVRIQKKAIGETSHAYYIISTAVKSMQLMVPVHRAATVGLRQVGKAEKLRQILALCAQPPEEEEIEKDLRLRQAAMREKLKSGHFREVAEVVRMLFFLNSRRPLGTVDRQLLEQGKEFLAGELALASGQEVGEAMAEVEDCLARMLEEE